MLKTLRPYLLCALTLPMLACQAPVIPDQANLNTETNTSSNAPLNTDNPETESEPVFSKALSKRSLDVSTVLRGEEGSSGANQTSAAVSAPASAEGATDSAEAPTEPQAAPSAMPAADIAIGMPAPIPAGESYGFAGPALSYYPGGGEFNHYIPVMAEEIRFAGDDTRELKDIYQNTVMPILAEWDNKARLLETRGYSNPSDSGSVEYIYLPGQNPEEDTRFKAHWVFRFASTPRKETLSIYINADETRAFRTVYGEPHLDMSRVEIGSTEALAIAEKAFANREAKPGYPVYPESAEYMGPNAEIVYDLPNELNWRINLNQQGSKLVYHLYFDYREQNGQPGVIAPDEDAAKPTPVSAIAVGAPAVPETDPAVGDIDEPNRDPDEPEVEPEPPPEPCYYERPYYEPYIYLNGSITIDASSGDVLSLNRPVRYDYDYPQAVEVYPCGADVPPGIPVEGGVVDAVAVEPEAEPTAIP